MRIAGYLVGYDAQGRLCHLVVDALPKRVTDAVAADLLRRRDTPRQPVYDLLIDTGDLQTRYLCLPALPREVVSHFQQGGALKLMELSSMRAVDLVVRLDDQEGST